MSQCVLFAWTGYALEGQVPSRQVQASPQLHVSPHVHCPPATQGQQEPLQPSGHLQEGPQLQLPGD